VTGAIIVRRRAVQVYYDLINGYYHAMENRKKARKKRAELVLDTA
jgi:hypothetical protein